MGQTNPSPTISFPKPHLYILWGERQPLLWFSFLAQINALVYPVKSSKIGRNKKTGGIRVTCQLECWDFLSFSILKYLTSLEWVIWNHKLNNYLTPHPNHNKLSTNCQNLSLPFWYYKPSYLKLNFNIWPSQALLKFSWVDWVWTKAALCCIFQLQLGKLFQG